MTAVPDPDELAPTRDPGAYGRRRPTSRGFWAMMGFGAVCMAAAAAVVVYFGGGFKHPRPAAQASQATPAAAVPAPYSPPIVAPPSPVALVAPTQIAALTDRVTLLETHEEQVLQAASLALAAAAISDAAADPRPFAVEMQAYGRYLPPTADVQALARLAGQGAPTRAALAAGLTERAAQASVAAREPAKDAGFMAQLSYALSRVISVRRLDENGNNADAALARAERHADDGDIEGAVAVLNTLAPTARAPLEGWLAAAGHRIEIDGRVAALRAQALADLAAVQGPAPASPPGATHEAGGGPAR
jgi:hypothetical protein